MTTVKILTEREGEFTFQNVESLEREYPDFDGAHGTSYITVVYNPEWSEDTVEESYGPGAIVEEVR